METGAQTSRSIIDLVMRLKTTESAAKIIVNQ